MTKVNPDALRAAFASLLVGSTQNEVYSELKSDSRLEEPDQDTDNPVFLETAVQFERDDLLARWGALYADAPWESALSCLGSQGQLRMLEPLLTWLPESFCSEWWAVVEACTGSCPIFIVCLQAARSSVRRL